MHQAQHMTFSLFKSSKANVIDAGAADAARFYDSTTDKFLAVYGEVIQAFRTRDVNDYLDYTISGAQLGQGMSVVDAGCGVCGPATYFASKVEGLRVDACTISPVQEVKAQTNIASKGLEERVTVHLADYHKLPDVLGKDRFDRVIFLESFGHSKDKPQAIRSAFEVLRPGGKLYIKDLFRRESDDEWEQLSDRGPARCAFGHPQAGVHTGVPARAPGAVRGVRAPDHFQRFPEHLRHREDRFVGRLRFPHRLLRDTCAEARLRPGGRGTPVPHEPLNARLEPPRPTISPDPCQ